MSNASTANETPKHSQDSNTEPTTTPSDDVAPPSPEQIKRELDKPLPVPVSAGPGDSPPLPPGHLDLLNDGITDQQSRREYRLPILGAALTVLAVFTICLAGVVFTLGNGFFQALQPENIAKFAAVELHRKIDNVSATAAEKETSSSKGRLEKPPQPWHDVSASNLTTLP